MTAPKYLVHFTIEANSIRRVEEARASLSRLAGCKVGRVTLGDGVSVLSKTLAEEMRAAEEAATRPEEGFE